MDQNQRRLREEVKKVSDQESVGIQGNIHIRIVGDLFIFNREDEPKPNPNS